MGMGGEGRRQKSQQNAKTRMLNIGKFRGKVYRCSMYYSSNYPAGLKI